MRFFFTIGLLFCGLVIMAQPPRHVFDATNPDVHDPVMARGEDGRYYIFSTGMGISVMSSSDMKTWRQEKSVFSVKAKMPDGKELSIPGNTPLPSWTEDSVSGFHGHIWAPDISYHSSLRAPQGKLSSGQDGKWYLYYSCSTFGKNGSAIGLATNKTLDPLSPYFKWEDQGCVMVSHRNIDDYNCIDPNLVAFQTDKQDKQVLPSGTGGYLVFGSFWDGIQMAPLADGYKTLANTPVTIARRYAPANNAKTADPAIEVVGNDTVEAGENAIEAPFIIYHETNTQHLTPNTHNGWYYLLVSWDYCCRGRNSTYKTVYGRSKNITGPYLDKNGKDMAIGGGTYLVGPDDSFYGVGHCAAYQLQVSEGSNESKQWYFISHAYDISKDGQSKLFIRKLNFTDDGWLELMPNKQ